jgi:hypothetical protein
MIYERVKPALRLSSCLQAISEPFFVKYARPRVFIVGNTRLLDPDFDEIKNEVQSYRAMLALPSDKMRIYFGYT